MYQKLRELSLCQEFQEKYPDWPYAMLFHGETITRDIFFLDSALDHCALDLGTNPVDSDLIPGESDHLSDWFHYRFFNGIAPVIGSAESPALLSRLYRLQATLFAHGADAQLVQHLQEVLCVSAPADMVSRWITSVDAIIHVAGEHKLCIWGVDHSPSAHREHLAYIKEKVSPIDIEAYWSLPHVRSRVSEWSRAFIAERKASRKAIAEYNRQRKQRKFQQATRV